MNLVVTGAAGFIGSHVAEILAASGHRVLGIDDLSGGFRENVPSSVEFLKRSILEPLDDVFATLRPQAVYHLAAYAAEGLSHHIPVFNYTNNTVGTANVLAASMRAGVKHFVFTSSIAAYGHPQSDAPFDEDTHCIPCDPYGAAKVACEHHIRATAEYFGHPDFTIFRPHNVFGPRQNISDPYRNVVGIFMARCLRGEPMPIFGDGSQSRSFSYVRTVARCIAEAPFTAAARNETFNVGGDQIMSVRDLALRIAETLGVPPNIESLPPRHEVQHAHSRHDRARQAFPDAYAEDIDIVSGLRLMAEEVRGRKIPDPTECPAPIEIPELLPPSWARRLGLKHQE
jgi:UDP-glucose 4-epimerase